jgi:PepSY-associated TM region
VRERTFWKDMHSVSAFYTTMLLVFILATGLPWLLGGRKPPEPLLEVLQGSQPAD